jgi:hypothetical protein
MKLWLVTWHCDGDHPSGVAKDWYASKAEAMGRKRELERDPDGHSFSQLYSVEAVDVPKDKAGLIRFLNTYTNE